MRIMLSTEDMISTTWKITVSINTNAFVTRRRVKKGTLRSAWYF